jgi:PAS domain S-box-containing protein
MRVRIGTRLGLTFAVLAAFVFLGSLIAIFELRQMWIEGEKVWQADAQVIAVLRVNNHMLQLQQTLQKAASARSRMEFKDLVQDSRGSFLADIKGAKELLQLAPSADKERAIRTLETIELSITSQLNTLDLLADANDWAAIDRRLEGQLPALSALSGQLVQEIDELGREEQEQAAGGIRRGMTQAIATVIATAIVFAIVAFVLGRKVTREIAGPIEQLRVASSALAKGGAVDVKTPSAQVELTELADAFQEMAQRVRASYQRLQESESLYRALTENASDVVLLTDERGVLTYASASAQRVLRCSARPLVGSILSELVEAGDRPLAQDMLERCLSQARPDRTWELRFSCVNEPPRILEIMGTNLLAEPAVHGIVLNGRDITERRIAEEALRRSESHLKQAQKMETVGRLAGGIAHDFNNLIGVIKGYTHLLEAKMPPGAPQRDYTTQIDRATEQAADLTRQLLAFSRTQNVTTDVTDVASALNESEGLLRRLMGEHIELSLIAPRDNMPVTIEPTQLQQVIINLCVNARDAMPKGGRLAITLRREAIDAAAAEMLGVATTGNYAHITVEDSGPGIPEDVLPHIFEPFFTTKDPDKGTGLGLFMVYGIVRQASGTVFVKSDRGQGSIFSIYLPEAAQAGAAKPETAKIAAFDGAGAVLLVEDNEMLRQMVTSYLQTRGFEVSAFSRPDEALKTIATRPAKYQLLLTDILMPQMHGTDLAVHVRAKYPDIHVLFMSGYAPEGGLDLSRIPGSDFIHKPFALDELSAKISSLLMRQPLSSKSRLKVVRKARG